ncbi:MAG: OsmC family protein [Parachlamydiales bacterium]
MTKVVLKMGANLRSEGGVPGAPAVVADGPKAYGGLEEVMGPTDLFAFSLGACILTMMGIKAGQLKLDLGEVVAEVEKKMVMKPKLMVGKFVIRVSVPGAVPEEARGALEAIARDCPIFLSLGPSVEKELTFEWAS